jgi:hypothetical protein
MIKLSILIIINLWLLFIFFKIILFNDMENDNIFLQKASLILELILSILDINIPTPNMLKILLVIFIIIISNLLILYFNKFAALFSLSIIGRYSYKIYTNYLINNNDFNYMGFKPKITSQISKETPIMIKETIQSSDN